MTREFLTYNQALALKELGFNEPCMAIYYSKDKSFSWHHHKDHTNDEPALDSGEFNISALLYQQAFRWFREKYELYQAVYADKRADDLTLLYKVHVYKLDEELSEYAYRWFKTYEGAESACLDKLIEIVKNNAHI